MVQVLLHGQKPINFLQLFMLSSEKIDELIASNLKRLRKKAGLTQDRLGELIDVDGVHIAQMEGARIGMGKDVMARLCNALKVESWEFHWTERAPIVKDEREQQKVYRHRIEEKLGIADEVARYEDYQIAVASRRGKTQDELIAMEMKKLKDTVERKFGKTLQLQKKKAG